LVWGQKIKSGFRAVSLRPCGPLALIPVNGKNEKGGKFGPKMTAVRDPGVAGR
jgi:hypothetical protein